MKKKKPLYVVRYLSVFISLFMFNVADSAHAGWLESLDAVSPAPTLELTDTLGGIHNLRALSGKVVLVNFWATWCSPCLEEMPSIKRLRKRVDDPSLVILGVNVEEPVGRVRQFVKRLSLDFPVLLDRKGEAYRSWKVKAYPTSYLVDGAGRLRFEAVGPIEWDDEEAVDAVKQLLEEIDTSEQ